MAKTNDTIADIIAEMRHNATARRRFTLTDAFGGYETITIDRANTMLSLADRLEAAHKREVDAIEADALSVGGLVEAMRQKEAICTKCRDGEPPKNCQFFGEPDGCSSPTYGHYPQLPIGDAAKLREALVKCREIALQWQADEAAGVAGTTDKPHARSAAEAVVDMEFEIDAALAAPPRNCDVYNNESCRMAYHLHGDGLMTMQAFADWLFAPAAEKEGGAK